MAAWPEESENLPAMRSFDQLLRTLGEVSRQAAHLLALSYLAAFSQTVLEPT